MTVLSTLDFNAGTEGADLSVSSPWSLNASVQMKTVAAAAVHGARGARLVAPSGFSQTTWTDPGGATSGVRVLSFYGTPRALASGVMYIGAVINSGTNVGSFRINANGTVSIRNGTSAVATSTEVLDLDTEYRFEWMMKSGTTGQELRVFVGESNSPYITLTGAMTTSTRSGFYFGLGSAAAGFEMDFDTIRIADDWTGPFGTPSNSAPVLTTNGNQTVEAGDTVTLSASATDADPGDTVTVSWAQLSGDDVTLGGSAGTRTFTAPAAPAALVFRATASDGTDSDTEDVTIYVVEPSDTLDVLTFDDLAEGADVTVSAPFASVGGTTQFQATAAAAAHGARGARIASAASYRRIEWSEDDDTTADRVIDFYITPRTLSTSTMYLTSITRDDSANNGGVRINANGTLSIRDVTTVVGTTTFALAVGTRHRIAWKTGTGGQEMRVYVGEAVTPSAVLTGTLGNPLHDKLAVGLIAAAAGASIDYDTIRIAEDWLGPYGTPSNTPPTINGGADRSVSSFEAVTLAATTDDLDGDIVTVTWLQTGGTTVTLGGSGATRTFTAPAIRAGDTLTFTATADDGEATATDTVVVTVEPHNEYAVVGGVEVPIHVVAVSS